MSKRTVIYTRTAVERGTAAHSIERQQQACRAYAERQGWKVIAVYADRGTSGTDSTRPGLQRLLKDVGEGDIHTVLVASRDRLARSAVLWQTIIETCKQHTTSVIAVQEQP